MNSKKLKKVALDLGADLCGIASIDRFNGAPEGFHPADVLPRCRSVVVLGARFLASTLYAGSTIPYTDVRNELTRQMDQLAIHLASQLESKGILALPVNAIGPCEWDARTGKMRGIISLKHAAVLAGLGSIGKNTLLINENYGNMLWLSALLVSEDLEPDPVVKQNACPEKCHMCLDVCPVWALDGVSMNQKKCWEYAFGTHNGGEWRIKCFECRSACPLCLGQEMAHLKDALKIDTP